MSVRATDICELFAYQCNDGAAEQCSNDEASRSETLNCYVLEFPSWPGLGSSVRVIVIPNEVILELPFLAPNTALVEQIGRIIPQPPAALAIAAWMKNMGEGRMRWSGRQRWLSNLFCGVVID